MKEPNTIKISANLSSVDVGYIDILIQKGISSSRTDFLHYAAKKEIDNHHSDLQKIIAEDSQEIMIDGHSADGFEVLIGRYDIDDAFLASLSQKRSVTNYYVIGQLHFNNIHDEDRLFKVIKSIKIFGKLYANDSIYNHYVGK
ncbi:hypothetical protein [Levilactobacillus enshiensis]|uniref:hypothetical protein n=1 Tax=Levilactobacillus enshiensis TaxID=2590213 RepID=UPI001179AD3E|nr:hypothetical protein [Levilactobacillus enshiensis]